MEVVLVDALIDQRGGDEQTEEVSNVMVTGRWMLMLHWCVPEVAGQWKCRTRRIFTRVQSDNVLLASGM